MLKWAIIFAVIALIAGARPLHNPPEAQQTMFQ